MDIQAEKQRNHRDWVDFEQKSTQTATAVNQKQKAPSARTMMSGSSSIRGGPAWMQEPIRADDFALTPPIEVPGREQQSQLPTPVIVNASGAVLQMNSPSLSMKNRSSSRSFASQEGARSSSRSRSFRSQSPSTRGRPQPVIIRGGCDVPNDNNASAVQQQPQAPRASSRVRQPSRERAAPAPGRAGSAPRGRPDSRTRSVAGSEKQPQRERSVSQTRSVGGASHRSSQPMPNDQNINPNAAPRQRGRSRPPVTARNGRPQGQDGGSTRGRSRSSTRDGRARTARSRSASLTRVTNQPQIAPPSPSLRSLPGVKSVGAGQTHASRQPMDRARSGSQTFSEDDHDVNIGRDIMFGNNGIGLSVCSTDSIRKKGLVGKLFGEQQQKKGDGGMGEQIRSRVLLAATVYHNTATGLWITTINTNQRGVARDPKVANKFLKAFSFPSELEARESAIANAPPKMIPFSEVQDCFLCKSSFTVFKRPNHCKNCGVCICKDCSVLWHSKMVPETYNLKCDAVVRVCRSCNTISKAFRRALIQGDLDGAVALYGTGNVNLRTPFPVANKKEEVVYPVHCAAEGGNLEILRWLVDDHFCPITTIPAGAKKVRRGSPESMILTSTGRHVLGIAIEKLKVDIMQYLVVDKGVSIYESKDLEPSLRALEATLLALPRSTDGRQPGDHEGAHPQWDSGSFDDMSIPSTIGVESTKPLAHDDSVTVGSRATRSSDYCIICFERKIDCVATPCGHQMCCVQCSSNLSACPVCNNKGDFIKIFRP